MAKFKQLEVEENVACNLIPMIDIMFLMLLFFMLGADMGQRDLSDVELPLADQIKEDDNVRGEGKLTTVNVHHKLIGREVSCAAYEAKQICRDETHWSIAIRGAEYTKEQIGPQLQLEGALDLEDAIDPAAGKKLSKRKVMIRSDQGAPYGFVQAVIQACANAGIYMVEVGAAKPPAQ